MIPWVALAAATAPDGDILRLWRRGAEFSIRLSTGNELMNSRLGGSEAALAALALARLTDRAAPVVLIGGLGMGFTLRAAQEAAPRDAVFVVSEIVPELLDWARGPMAPVFRDCLDDPRVRVRIGDVGTLIAARPAAYDAILLDVDNGPDGLTRPANDALYLSAGLAGARAALRPGGVLAVWSAHPAPAFARRLRTAGFEVTETAVRAGSGRRGPRHVIWLARR